MYRPPVTDPSGSGWRHGLARAGNAWRRVRSGLPAAGGALSPEVPNDLYQAHLSIYHFSAGLARGKRVLDLACGTGYGSARLLAGGAGAVTGVESDARLLRYAERRHGAPGISFVRGDPAALPAGLGAFDLAVAVGALPRLGDPGRALAGIAEHLAAGGALVASLPPILDGQALALHRALPRARSSLYLWDWESLLGERFRSLRLFRHLPPPGRLPDLAAAGPSTLAPEDFRFEELPLAEIYDVGSLTAIFVGEGPR